MSYKPTAEERADRRAARLEILQAVNQYRIRSNRRRMAKSRIPLPAASLLGARHIQQAVFACRQMPGLVAEETLARAGFKPRVPHTGKPTTAAQVARTFAVPLDMLVDYALRSSTRRAA